MIDGNADRAFQTLVPTLERQARALAIAHARAARLARQQDPRRWRRAALVWPNFAKG